MKTAAPGQVYRDDFPRFGLDQFADRVVEHDGPWSVTVGGDVAREVTFDEDALDAVPRSEQVSDFHCVTTWSHADIRWSGYRLADVYEKLIAPQASPKADVAWFVAYAHDGYRTRLTIEDALASDVMLADRMNGEPLSIAHGAPLRLVAPRLYGFKNVKHLKRIALVHDLRDFVSPTPIRLMDHPRGRVAYEERGGLPGPLLRWIYRPLVASTVRKFARGLAKATRAK